MSELTPEHDSRQVSDGLRPEVTAAYKYVDSVLATADAQSPIGGYAWHGWALREAFLAGCTHARRPTPQPVAEGPSDQELMAALKAAIVSFPPQHPEAKHLSADEYEVELEIRKARAVLACLGRPTPQPEVADIHYAWELLDAEGEWQAGGSANSLDDVQREGNRYRQIYSQHRPHRLIIQRHCVNTIEEVTNG